MAGMDALGLPDPSDYNPPTNGDQRHPWMSTQPAAPADPTVEETATAGAAPAGPAQTDTASVESAPAQADPGQDTFPPPPPSVVGAEVTESVYQQGQ